MQKMGAYYSKWKKQPGGSMIDHLNDPLLWEKLVTERHQVLIRHLIIFVTSNFKCPPIPPVWT